ncbi:MAG: alpha/beta hydrolase-fold protein [Bacteroidota bacterium]
MHRHLQTWYSPRLHKDMEIAMYGHWGFALLMFPTAAADYLEYERFQLIDAIQPYIDSGKVKVFSINSINRESWMNDQMHPRDKAIRHQQFNEYVTEEVVPFIRMHSSNETPIITTGASLGAFHAANTLFRRPDIFTGTIAMSGDYDLKSYTRGYYDDNVYFNSPVDYLERLTDGHVLNQLRHKRIHIVTGQGPYENPGASHRISNIMHGKGIPHELDVWGHDMGHDWPTWRAMLPHYLATRF